MKWIYELIKLYFKTIMVTYTQSEKRGPNFS